MKKSITILCLILVAVAALGAGLKLRRWHWDFTRPIHFTPDMNNAMLQGSRGVQNGYLSTYSAVKRWSRNENYNLDYPPLRLLVFTFWSRWLTWKHPEVGDWTPYFDINAPVLLFNAFMESASAVLAFFLVWKWREKSGLRGGILLGTLAALFLWFNPQLIISSWGRPAWEVWVVPFYLYAMLLASMEEWLCSGMVLAMGTMFKGQEGLVAPVFVLWPIFAGKFLSAFRWAAGYAFGAALIAGPWLVSKSLADDAPPVFALDYRAVSWIVCVVLGVALILIGRYKFPANRRWFNLATGAAFVLFAWPAATADGQMLLIIANCALVAVAMLRFIPWKVQPAIVAAIVGGAMFACIDVFNTNTDWYTIAFVYGSEKFKGLETGPADSLAPILGNLFHWDGRSTLGTLSIHPYFSWLSQTIPFDITKGLWTLYVISLVVCSIGIANLYRRRDVRWLLGMATPWMLYFALAPQMHERYLLWGASVGSVILGVSLRGSLLVIIMSILSWMMCVHQLLSSGRPADFGKNISPTFGQTLNHFVGNAHPNAGWIAILAAAILLVQTLGGRTPSKRKLAQVP